MTRALPAASCKMRRSRRLMTRPLTLNLKVPFMSVTARLPSDKFSSFVTIASSTWFGEQKCGLMMTTGFADGGLLEDSIDSR